MTRAKRCSVAAWAGLSGIKAKRREKTTTLLIVHFIYLHPPEKRIGIDSYNNRKQTAINCRLPIATPTLCANVSETLPPL
jgi:hypothetical protein